MADKEKKSNSLLDTIEDVSSTVGNSLLDTFVPGGNEASKNLRLIKMALKLNENRAPGEAPATKYLEAIEAGQLDNDLDAQMKKLQYQKLYKELNPEILTDEEVKRPYTKDEKANDEYASQAFGVFNQVANLFGAVGRSIPGDPDFAPQTNKGKTSLRGLNVELLRGAAEEVSGRPSVYYLQLSKDEIPQIDEIFETDINAQRMYETIRDKFVGKIARNDALLKVAIREGKSDKIIKIQKANANQKYYKERLDNIILQMNKTTGINKSGVQTDFTPKANEYKEKPKKFDIDDFQRKIY